MTETEARRLVEQLEAEVNNGGFDQYFFNSAGNEAAATLEALELIGAPVTASILRRACLLFPGETPPTDRIARQEMLKGISPEGEAFNELDKAFYAYEEHLAALIAAVTPTSPAKPWWRFW